MDALDHIAKKFNLDLSQPFIEIPDTTRDDIAVLIKELSMHVGVEVGVERGLYSEVILRENPGIDLVCVDAWTAYKGYRDHVSQDKLDGIMADAKARLEPLGGTLIKGFSMDVVKQFKDNSLDFVYIDGNHEFQHTVNDICEWSKKVKPGGIVAGHDYIKRSDPGYLMHVPMALHGYAESYHIKPVFILGRKERVEGEKRESTRSWMFIKPQPPTIKPGSKGN